MVLLRISLLLLLATPLWAQSAAESAMAAAKAALRQQNYVGALAALQSPELQQSPEILLMQASLYQTGRGLPRDDAKSFALTRQAAELGSVDAQYALGRLLLSGRGVEANRAAGQAWVAKAAEAGHIRAAALLVNLLQSPAAPAAAAPTLATALPPVQGSDISRRLGWTPLMEAARRGQHELLQILLPTADLDAQDSQGRTALMLAAEANDPTAIALLLGAGASVSAADKAGNTALGYAARAGLETPSLLLLAAGAAADLPNARGQTPLALAIRAGQSALAEHMLAQQRRAMPREILENLWFLASIHGTAPLMRALVIKGAQCGWRSAAGQSAVDFATRASNLATLNFCLENGRIPAESLAAPLIMAANNGSIAMAQALLTAGADVNSQSQNGNTALLIAAREGNTALLALLLDHGADVNHRNHGRNSALMLAALNGHEAALRALMAAGADTSLRNAKREQAADIAASAGHAALVSLLE